MVRMSEEYSVGLNVLATLIVRSAGIQTPEGSQPVSLPKRLGQTHISFNSPGTPSTEGWITSKPWPPKSQRFPLLSVQAIGKSLPPGVLAFAVANAGDKIGCPAV